MAEIRFAAYCAGDNKVVDNFTSLKARIDATKKHLNAAKTSLDEAFTKSYFDVYWREFDPFKQEKYIIDTMLSMGQQKVTNAWLKCYEMLAWISETHKFPDEIKHFDNAAFPGAFILAANHYFKTKRSSSKTKKPYDWVASSLITANSDDSKPLEDTYGLYARYKNQWLMTETNNGDVTSTTNLADWERRLAHGIDLYTSDLGFDVSSEYNAQEKMQSRANYAQILAGILTLKAGGVMITKQYTIFEDATITCLYMLSTIFSRLYICKPATSRQANSETYIIGIGFSEDKSAVETVANKLYAAIADETYLFCDPAEITPEFLGTIDACMRIFESQTEKIAHDRDAVLKIRKMQYKGKPSKHPEIVKFRKSIDGSIAEWYRRNDFLPLRDADRL